MSTKNFLLASLFCLLPFTLFANPIKDLLERIDPGASKKFVIQLQKNADKDFFELDQKGDKVVVRGNTYVNIATGLNMQASNLPGTICRQTCRKRFPKSPTPNGAKPTSACVMISTIARILIRWHSGTGHAGKKKSTGWHCMASTCRLPQ